MFQEEHHIFVFYCYHVVFNKNGSIRIHYLRVNLGFGLISGPRGRILLSEKAAQIIKQL